MYTTCWEWRHPESSLYREFNTPVKVASVGFCKSFSKIPSTVESRYQTIRYSAVRDHSQLPRLSLGTQGVSDEKCLPSLVPRRFFTCRGETIYKEFHFL